VYTVVVIKSQLKYQQTIYSSLWSSAEWYSDSCSCTIFNSQWI